MLFATNSLTQYYILWYHLVKMIDSTHKRKMLLMMVINKINIKGALPFSKKCIFVMIHLCDWRHGISNVLRRYVVLLKLKSLKTDTVSLLEWQSLLRTSKWLYVSKIEAAIFVASQRKKEKNPLDQEDKTN